MTSNTHTPRETPKPESPAARDRLLTALGEEADPTGATTKQLAAAIGIGYSTASKHMAALEDEGKVVRTRTQQQPGAIALPDRWHLAAPTSGPPTDTEPDTIPRETTSIDTASAAASAVPAGNAGTTVESAPSPVLAPTPRVPSNRPGEQVRLRSGQLRAQVLEQLSGNPDREFTPGEIARLLGGRSSGAVANALATLEGQGLTKTVGTRPLRYASSSPSQAGTATSSTDTAVPQP